MNVIESEENVNIRITLQAIDSENEIEAFSYACPPDKARAQTFRINLPDERQYICRVYQNEEITDTLETGATEE